MTDIMKLCTHYNGNGKLNDVNDALFSSGCQINKSWSFSKQFAFNRIPGHLRDMRKLHGRTGNANVGNGEQTNKNRFKMG